MSRPPGPITLRRSAVPGKVPTPDQLEYGEIAINTHDGKIFLKRNKDALEQIMEFVGKVPVENVIFIQKSGSDTNAGDSWDTAYATFEKALEKAATRNGAVTLIDVGPGVYMTRGHLDMPDNTLIRCVHRSVFIRPEPGYEERNVFRMGSGCFIEGPEFEGWRIDDLDNPTEGFAASFRPGAVITRAPYVHKIGMRSIPTWTTVAPPLDRDNGNPLVGKGGGVVLADGLVCSPYSVFPNIMTWGATPVSQNGIGYVAKNGGLVNAVNAISIWAHKHFYAIDGGQIILSSCATQFGDYTLVSKGVRKILVPNKISIDLIEKPAAATSVISAKTNIATNLWIDLVSKGYTTGWTSTDEQYTKTDTENLVQCIGWVLQSANEKPMLDFAKGLFDTQANSVIQSSKLPIFLYSFEYIRDYIISLGDIDSETSVIVHALIASLIDTITSPVKVSLPSTITAIGHTWTAIMAGVALTKIPPAQNFNSIQESILELDQGVVIASGQDDQGSALFIGGMEINADTGELSGPPFEQSVNRIATRTSIARSF